MRRPTVVAFMVALLRQSRGGTAITFTALVPILAVLGAGAVELGELNADRSTTQDAADAAALMAAKQLSVDPNGVEQRANGCCHLWMAPAPQG
jgi:Flp pilus assembly protein TadG